ncbi:MAG: hypothetical protein ABI822_25815, partial [Bryobacteraceae bacterium]
RTTTSRFGDLIKGIRKACGSWKAACFHKAAAHGGHRAADLAVLDVGSEGYTPGLQLETGAGTATGGVLSAVFRDEALVDQLGNDAGYRAFRETTLACNFGTGHALLVAKELEDDCPMSATNLRGAQDSPGGGA